MNRASKVAVRALIVGGVAVVALATATTRRCDNPAREPGQENVAPSSEPTTQPVPTAAPRPPQLAPPAAPAPKPASLASLNEAQLMARLRSVKDHAAAAIELARDGNRRFPDTADAPERTSILIHALANQGASSEARGEAEQMVNHYPDSDWVREIERFTGAHRHRNIRLNDAGALEYH